MLLYKTDIYYVLYEYYFFDSKYISIIRIFIYLFFHLISTGRILGAPLWLLYTLVSNKFVKMYDNNMLSVIY